MGWNPYGQEPAAHRYRKAWGLILLVLVFGSGFIRKLPHPSHDAAHWLLNTGETVLAAPAVAPTRAFLAGDDGRLYAVQTSDGAQLWECNLGARPATGLLSLEQQLVAGLADGRLLCLRTVDGGVVWSADLPAAPTPQLARCGNVLLAVTDRGLLRGFRLTDGAALWRVELPAAPLAGPVAGQDLCFLAFADGHLEARDAGGVSHWSFRIAETAVRWLAVHERELWAAADDGVVYQLDPNSGQILKQFGLEQSLTAPPLRRGDRLWVVTQTGRVVGLALDGTLLWSAKLPTAPVGSPALVGQALCVVGRDQRVHTFDTTTGRAGRQARLGEDVSAPLVGTPDGLLYATWGGQVGLLNAAELVQGRR